MGRRLFLLLFSCFIGATISPSILTADQVIEVNQPDFNAVQTKIIEPTPAPAPVEVAKPQSNKTTPKSPVVKQAVASEPKIANYSVSFYIGSIEEYTNTALNLSYSGIYKFRKMIYGHNSSNLLGSLNSRYIGEKFTITENGVTKTYQVISKVTYKKHADGSLEGNPKLMNNIANNALGHDIALLTCAGQSYGNGDASHRLVVFANQI